MALDKSIKGLNIKIGADSTALGKALKDVEKSSRDISKELSQVNKLLKFSPNDTTLLTQKQKLLGDQIGVTKDRLDKLKSAQADVNEQFKRGDIPEEQYRAFQREIVETESKLKTYKDQLKETNKTHREFGAALQEAGQKMKDVGGKISGIGQDLTTKVTLPLAAAGAASFKFAADLQDAMGASDQIFKGSSDEIKSWADGLESYYGIAESEALTYANTMGAMLQNIGGLSEAEAAKQSEMLVELAGDLTAMFGGTTESAVQALTGALKGNTSMLDNYGMGVNDATIKTKALEMGLWDGTGQMELATKQAATLALIMEQTGDAQGQAAREADGASGSMRGLTTELKNIAGEIGEVLLPIITPMIQKLKEIIEKFKELSPEQKEMIVQVGLLAAALGPLLVIIGSVISTIGSLSMIAGTLGITLGALAAPIGIAVLAIAGLVTAGILLYKNWDTIKEKATELFNKVKETFDNIKTNVTETITNLVTDTIQWGKDMVQGLWKGITDTKDWLLGKIKGFADSVARGFKDFFGIASPSKLMAEYGKNIDEGLAEGITDNEIIPLNAIQSVGEKMATAASNAAKTVMDLLTITDDSYSISGPAGTVSYGRKSSSKAYSDRKQSDLTKYADEIAAIANKHNVDMSVGYDMFKSNELDKIYGREETYKSSSKSSGITQNITVNSPKALTPSEIARETAKAATKLVLPLLR